MPYLLSTFFESLRALVGDEGDLATGYDYSDSQLSAALRTVVHMGFVPSLSIGSKPDVLANAPGNPDTWGFLVAKAAHILIGGATPVSLRTRAISLETNPSARRDSLTYIELMLSDIDARGNVGGTSADTEFKGLFGTITDVMTYCAIGAPFSRVPVIPPPPVFPKF